MISNQPTWDDLLKDPYKEARAKARYLRKYGFQSHRQILQELREEYPQNVVQHVAALEPNKYYLTPLDDESKGDCDDLS